MPRFVILRHEPLAASDRTLHWDLMLESDDTLLTWAMEAELAEGTSVPARQLENHRRHYLDYEGPITGGRGTVRRWDFGEFQWQQRQDGSYIVLVEGQILRGVVQLIRLTTDDQRWRISYGNAPINDVR